MTMDPCRVRVGGPLAAYAPGFREALLGRGYPGERTARHLQLLAQLSRWLDYQGLDERDLDEQRVAEFLAARRADGYFDKPSRAWALALLGLVPGLVVTRTEPAPPTPAQSLVAQFASYLTTERGLAAGTVRGYRDVAELFVSRRAMLDGELTLSAVNAASVTSFVVEESRRRSAGATQVTVTALRSLLRFLFLEGHLEESLAQVVPAVSASKGFLPRALAEETVSKLLFTCDHTTAIGLRDLAVLTLLTRLGLRCAEVAGLELDDLDWHHGEVVIRGKGSRRDRLPLPVDVGDALAAYLHDGRPRVECRAVFLRVKAPITAMGASNVTCIVMRACEHAGVTLAGAHRLRHSTATATLRAGAPLAEIGQLLRQTHAATTAVYAKVDRIALRPLARPWPGAPA